MFRTGGRPCIRLSILRHKRTSQFNIADSFETLNITTTVSKARLRRLDLARSRPRAFFGLRVTSCRNWLLGGGGTPSRAGDAFALVGSPLEEPKAVVPNPGSGRCSARENTIPNLVSLKNPDIGVSPSRSDRGKNTPPIRGRLGRPSRRLCQVGARPQPLRRRKKGQ